MKEFCSPSSCLAHITGVLRNLLFGRRVEAAVAGTLALIATSSTLTG